MKIERLMSGIASAIDNDHWDGDGVRVQATSTPESLDISVTDACTGGTVLSAQLKDVPVGYTLVKTDELERLRGVDEWMDCLYAAGIDNAEAYDEACRLRREAQAEQDCE